MIYCHILLNTNYLSDPSLHIVIVTKQHQGRRQCALFTHVYVFVVLTVPRLYRRCLEMTRQTGLLMRQCFISGIIGTAGH